MATSGLLTAINEVLTAVRAIAFDWSTVPDAVKSRPNNLFQKVLMWNDQVDREKNGSGYTFAKPACFLELMNMGNSQLAEGLTTADYIYRFHIVDMELDAGNDSDLDQNLTVIGYRDLLKQNMVGFTPSNSSTMFAVDEDMDKRHTDVYHYTLDLKSLFMDTKGTILDPDQTKVIYTGPPTDADLTIGFEDEVPELELIITPPVE